MPQIRKYADGAERQAAYNERLREKERIRLMEERRVKALSQTRQRQASIVAGKILKAVLLHGTTITDRLGVSIGQDEESQTEMIAYIHEFN